MALKFLDTKLTFFGPELAARVDDDDAADDSKRCLDSKIEIRSEIGFLLDWLAIPRSRSRSVPLKHEQVFFLLPISSVKVNIAEQQKQLFDRNTWLWKEKRRRWSVRRFWLEIALRRFFTISEKSWNERIDNEVKAKLLKTKLR